ncbi:MAG: NAD(P)H-hydrate dehydratase [Gammaproteobacteria bacterium]|jgi:NAD(P)H-hydrate epimerase|nr:NAD(P)H-hydrate dehydratase [Gammaproteobacteria bacterium]MBT3987572.1 NAD(P)H-hydrate dehydratase [Gammaproteobacteria bacterium]MBT4257132.1 NAD(P)H-hydrate dehydratase [Gammaproteobacteria bacterium]MBT4581690.1 NAD(P)H-hydrate dehydratase [Gammaproteobacteria bacterium]MBT4659550.1 NAD(P)H-hydrate dehydratase [Gammaproteobacteria bacterium]
MSDFSNRLPRDLYRAAQVQQLDQVAIKDFGIPGFKLMQTAGAACFDTLMEAWPQTRHLLVFCGAGNNAGDGYIIAGLAKEQGIAAEVVQLSPGQNLKGDAATAWQWALEKQVLTLTLSDLIKRQDSIHANTVLVDALFGTGLDREVEGEYASAIEFINQSDSPVLAVDIPSGLSADTGRALGRAVVADITVTFIGLKQGLLTNSGRDYIGQLIYHDLDVPPEIFHSESSPTASAQRIDINYALQFLRPRASSSHKGNHGHVVLIGGDYSYGGAILMAAEAAQRSGAGLVSVITRSAHRPAILARRPELMVMGTEDEGFHPDSMVGLLERADALVLGPGLGRGQWSQQLFQAALAVQSAGDIPLVIDADGLQLLADKGSPNARLKRDNWILTPHPGEASILLGVSSEEIQRDRFESVSRLQKKWGGACLLKGSGSLICTQEEGEQKLFLCSEGNPGMASGGMGDVLSGVIAGLLANEMSLEDSLCCAVCIHGEAADLSAQELGAKGMAASDLFKYIRQLINPSL